MSLRVPVLCTALLTVILAAPVRAQETKASTDPPVKEVAQLVPASTLFYVEMRHADKLSKEIAALTKGSALDEMQLVLAKARAKLGDKDYYWFGEMLEMFGVFLSPEIVAEAGKLQGGFFAITSIGKDGPEMVGLVQPGTSNAPAFFMRFYLTVDGDIRPREVIEGVQTYQARRREWNRVAPGQPGVPPPPPMFKDSGPTFAMLNGAIVMGTKEATHDVIRRYKGKGKGDALNTTTVFKESSKLREQPGLYFQADLPNLGKQLDTFFVEPKTGDASWWKMVKMVVNPEAFKNASGNLTLTDGKLGLQLHVDLDPKATSPVLELLPDRKGSLDLLQAMPANGVLNLTFSFSDGATRWGKFVTLLDTLVKESGSKDVPSKEIRDMEQKVKLNIGKELFGQVKDVGLVFEMGSTVPKNATRMPLILVHAVDADAAKSIEDQVIPKLVSMGSTTEALPTREKILEQSISILPVPTQAWGILCYGRSGKLVVVGQDRKTVAETLLRFSKKEGVLSHKTIGPALEKLDGAIAIGTSSPGQSLVELLRELETPRTMVGVKPIGPGPGQPPMPPKDEKKDPKKDDDKPKVFDKFVNLMAKEVELMPPAVLSLTRTKERLTLNIQTPGLTTYSAKIINVWVEAAIERTIREQELRRIGGGGGIIAPQIDEVPPPPLEKKE